MRINVNGTDHDIPRGDISYQQIVSLAGAPDAKEMTVVYYLRGRGDSERKGSLSHGKSVAGDDGMQFTAVYTGNA